MAASHDEPPTLRYDSPSPESTPVRAREPRSAMPRCLSAGSSTSRASSTDGGSCRDSLSSEAYSRKSSSSYYSRRSDLSFASSRQSTMSLDKPLKRRGYSRPLGTDFAASARHRESVLSLGSISHLQYYFARTGLLDGKGGQLARKRHPKATLDLSSLDSSSLLSPRLVSDGDSPYASMASSPDLVAQTFGEEPMVESPIFDHDRFDSDDYEEAETDILPPTTSTYRHRERHIPKPPTIEELKASLTKTLDDAARILAEVASSATPPTPESASASPKPGKGWYELQGMQVLDVMTLAIQAAKLYYTAHELPDRLDAIKSEKEIRTELLSVMEVLKHAATRNFAGGYHEDELKVMTSWIDSIRTMLQREEEMEATERAERASWVWLKGDWTGREIERELAFMSSIDSEAEPLPPWTPIKSAAELPTPFLESLQNGLRLVRLHNASVKKLRRRFGAIGSFHTDTQKPYRCADNLRYWIKAAELRWEVMLKVDVRGVVYNDAEAWKDFEAAIWQWCRKVREEITADWEQSEG
ncbi:hypothetical protein F4802DRAFT_155914 [Xylaria palmicola]|nr:hypothetical protein F4802DRAFT_155914 [Xylaria palmicola]